MLKPPKKIEDLRQHLNETAAEHNNKGYDEFIRMITQTDEFGDAYPKTKIARAFSVSKPTIYNWLEIYKREQRNA